MTVGGAIVVAAARMGPLALIAAPFGRAWAARAIVGALLVAAVLPWVMALNAIFHAVIGIVVWLVGYAILFGVPHATAALFPFVLLSFFPVLLGLGWLLSAIGVAVRDVGQLTALLGHALLFLTPIFYSLEAVPASLRALLMANPLTFAVEQLRAVLTGYAPAATGLVAYFAAATLFAWGSLALFRRLRPTFAELV